MSTMGFFFFFENNKQELKVYPCHVVKTSNYNKTVNYYKSDLCTWKMKK